ncbi:Putative oxidoreductase/Short-chain dehydrogenase [Minicystis rosea]|nr:Putative oxidoreductase/Short-chain dehydrogenase [Minicystis rosea]
MRQVAKDWGTKDIGDLTGKQVIVTGANSGIGFHTALELGRAGAQVVVACRDVTRGEEAVSRLRAEGPAAAFRFEQLDLASLASVRAFAERFLSAGSALDILVNNAGVMAIPAREQTVDGFERQIGTNHLGHFALTGLLVPALRRSAAPRVVTISSGTAYFGCVDLANLQSERRYSPAFTYAQSKLANLHFMLELGRRAPWLVSVAAHPGATHTNLQQYTGLGTRISMRFIGQQAADGALPSLYAANGAVASGEFYGPRRLFNMNGPPVEVRLPRRARDEATARALWEASERLTGVRFDLSEPARRTA